MVQHVNSEAGYDALEYDPVRGWGFEVINDGAEGRDTAERFGPFDSSPNNRDEWDDTLPDQMYDSFIGGKNFETQCDAVLTGDALIPCSFVIEPEGLIFRVDVPNGQYRFLGVFGDADNTHAHRVLVEDGGIGEPTDIGLNTVQLVHNHDQAQFDIGTVAGDDPGDGVYARVGFDGVLPPLPQGNGPVPVFVDMDQDGLPTDTGPDSPTLEVTQGYLRVHLLQGNSNDGDGGGRDPNGGDIVLFEAWSLTTGPGGDFNGDGLWNTLDIDLLGKEIISGSNDLTFDMNDDGLVNLADQDQWRADGATVNGFASAYLNGDANLDGKVDAGDLNEVGLNWQRTVDPWSQGDFDASNFVDAGDLNLLGLNWQKSILPAAAVPEPSGLTFLLIGLFGVVARHGRVDFRRSLS
jgi:hypothetical protein